MKAQDLYAMVPEYTTLKMYALQGYGFNHVPEIEWSQMPLYADLDGTDVQQNTRVHIKIYKDHSFDHRRLWRLSSVWIDEKPVMIIQNAGREGDDHSARFVTDVDAYTEMVQYLRTLQKPENIEVQDLLDPDMDFAGLTHFYGCDLQGDWTEEEE